MSRRKHLLQSLEEEVEAPGEGQHIVRALGSRGSNIIEVEFPDGRSTLCLLPAKFHKKLWVKKGNYLIIEDAPEAGGEGSRVTGQILAVLFADHVKQLKRMAGVWPPEFESSSASQAADQLAALGLAESDGEEGEGSSAAARQQQGGDAAAAQQSQAAGQPGSQAEAAGEVAPASGGEEGGSYYSSSDDDLPPIPKFNNRKVIEYVVSDSDSDDE